MHGGERTSFANKGREEFVPAIPSAAKIGAKHTLFTMAKARTVRTMRAGGLSE
jgi:hypothetical protein